MNRFKYIGVLNSPWSILMIRTIRGIFLRQKFLEVPDLSIPTKGALLFYGAIPIDPPPGPPGTPYDCLWGVRGGHQENVPGVRGSKHDWLGRSWVPGGGGRDTFLFWKVPQKHHRSIDHNYTRYGRCRLIFTILGRFDPPLCPIGKHLVKYRRVRPTFLGAPL